MPQVTYDGEKVEFQGQAPERLDGLIELLRQNAAQSGRVLMSVKVDGKDAFGGQVDFSSTGYSRVEVTTGTDKQLYLKALDMTLLAHQDPDAVIDPVLEGLLSESWNTAFTRLNDFLQGLAPYFELLANISKYGEAAHAPWSGELEKQLGEMEGVFTKVLKLSETQQVAELTSALNFELRPLYAGNLTFLKSTVRSYFGG